MKRISERFYKIRAVLTVLAAAFLCGCSDNSMYETYFTGTGELNGGLPFWFNTVKGVYDYLRQWLVLMILISFAAGIFILRAFSKRNKTLKKVAVFGFMIDLPIILIIIFFAMAFALNKYY